VHYDLSEDSQPIQDLRRARSADDEIDIRDRERSLKEIDGQLIGSDGLVTDGKSSDKNQCTGSQTTKDGECIRKSQKTPTENNCTGSQTTKDGECVPKSEKSQSIKCSGSQTTKDGVCVKKSVKCPSGETT
jgi:hypothetical protein